MLYTMLSYLLHLYPSIHFQVDINNHNLELKSELKSELWLELKSELKSELWLELWLRLEYLLELGLGLR